MHHKTPAAENACVGEKIAISASMTEPANRRPNPNPKPRLESLATLPVFFKLRDKKVVLAGDSEAVAWKAELLAATGALVALFAPHPCEKLAELIADVPNLHWQARGWQADDLVDAALAIADIEDAEQAQLFRSAARAAGVPANVIDRPEWCDFQFGAIVERSPLVIGISTDGAAPVFGQRPHVQPHRPLQQSSADRLAAPQRLTERSKPRLHHWAY